MIATTHNFTAPPSCGGFFLKVLLRGRWLQNIFRVSAWLLVLVITVLTLIPPSYRPTTEAPHSVEHLAIFLATGLAFGVGYSGRLSNRAVAILRRCRDWPRPLHQPH